MGWLDFWKQEKRAEPEENTLVKAVFGETEMDKEKVLQIAAVRACVNKLSDTVARLPIRLYHKTETGVEEVQNDARLRLLNEETGDTLSTDEFWKCMVEDYYLGKGGFAYLNREGNKIKSLHYVKEENISIQRVSDPIFKDYDILVQGKRYLPYAFFKIRRRARDGDASRPIWEEQDRLFGIAYNTMVFEENLVKKGGNKRGFIESESRLSQEAMQAIKDAWRNLYSNNSDNVVILNNGAKFKESSNTSVEMQLCESKAAISTDICRIFGIPAGIITGGATDQDKKEYIGTVMGLLNTIETAMDRDLLLETEKGSFYFAFDTKELTRGDLKERYEAYEIALKNHFLQPDEVRKQEDLEPMGFNWLTLGLNDVLLDPEKGIIYTPNTNQVFSAKDAEIPKA